MFKYRCPFIVELMTQDSTKKHPAPGFDFTFTVSKNVSVLQDQLDDEQHKALIERLEKKYAAYNRYYAPTPAGASIDERLLYAVGHSDLQEVKTLLEQGAAVNGTDDEGKTPLIVAFWVGGSKKALEIVKLLLAQGADIDIKAKDGVTALYCAVQSGEDEFIELLLDAGADAALAASYARRNHMMRIADWLDQVAAGKI